jgi:hypothetical protein
MKKLNNFWFGAMLTLSIVFVVWCFGYADEVRGFNSTGTEVFTLALPLLIVWKKFKAMGQKIERLKQYNKAMEKAML